MSFGNDIQVVLSRLSHAESDIAKYCFAESITQIQDLPAHDLLMTLSVFPVDAKREVLGI